MPLVDQLGERYHALSEGVSPFGKRFTGQRGRSPVPPSAPSAPAEAEGTGYAVRFLAFVYGVPFRLLAFQQELNDVFGYFGEWDEAFRERWGRWSVTERAAFRCALIEFRRLHLLHEQFQLCERHQEGREISDEERCSEMVAAYDVAVSQWYEQFSRQGQDIASGTIPTTILGGDAEALGPLAGAFSEPAPSSQLTLELDTETVPEPAPVVRKDDRVCATAGDFTFYLPRDISERNLSSNEITDAVLAALAENEISESEVRFLARVRWVLSLTKQQRSAVVHRLLGYRRKQIAIAMGIAEESVKTHLQRADSQWANRSGEIPRPPRRHGRADITASPRSRERAPATDPAG